MLHIPIRNRGHSADELGHKLPAQIHQAEDPLPPFPPRGRYVHTTNGKAKTIERTDRVTASIFRRPHRKSRHRETTDRECRITTRRRLSERYQWRLKDYRIVHHSYGATTLTSNMPQASPASLDPSQPNINSGIKSSPEMPHPTASPSAKIEIPEMGASNVRIKHPDASREKD